MKALYLFMTALAVITLVCSAGGYRRSCTAVPGEELEGFFGTFCRQMANDTHSQGVSVKAKTILLLLPCLFIFALCAEALEPIPLPGPEKDGGKPLMQALNERRTERSFSSQPLPRQVLSNMLWAAFGINRPGSGKRTAPSAVNWQEIDIYVALERGLYLYDARENVLQPVRAGDIRAATGRQGFVKDAPVNLVFVADDSRMGSASQEDKDFYSAADTGFISQNVYLFCASEGLATVVRAMIDREMLAEKMNLRSDQRIILAQTVGFPEE
jgi:nitroreductase